jgi:hypothetical protein
MASQHFGITYDEVMSLSLSEIERIITTQISAMERVKTFLTFKATLAWLYKYHVDVNVSFLQGDKRRKKWKDDATFIVAAMQTKFNSIGLNSLKVKGSACPTSNKKEWVSLLHGLMDMSGEEVNLLWPSFQDLKGSVKIVKDYSNAKKPSASSDSSASLSSSSSSSVPSGARSTQEPLQQHSSQGSFISQLTAIAATLPPPEEWADVDDVDDDDDDDDDEEEEEEEVDDDAEEQGEFEVEVEAASNGGIDVDLDSSNNEDTLFNSEFDKRVLKHFNERIEELKKKFNRTSPHVDEWD